MTLFERKRKPSNKSPVPRTKKKVRSVLTFDPGLHGSGWAHFYDGVLESCGLVAAETVFKRTADLGPIAAELVQALDAAMGTSMWDQVGRTLSPDVLVVEVPQVYDWGKGDPNDLVAVAFAAGSLATSFSAAPLVVTCWPHDWKGSVPKDIHNERVLGRLSAGERRLVDDVPCKASLKHNVLDAVGLGLWYLKRS